MKIISGKHKGRKLFTERQSSYRPTTSLVRKSLFNILLNGDILTNDKKEAFSFMDICSGHGGCGFEAISLGASFAAFLDISHESISLIRQNASLLSLAEGQDFAIYRANILKAFPCIEGSFDVIYCDPPYDRTVDIINTLLNEPSFFKLFNGDAILVIESSSNDQGVIAELLSQYFSIEKQRSYGASLLTFGKLLQP